MATFRDRLGPGAFEGAIPPGQAIGGATGISGIRAHWPKIALGAIMALSAFLQFFRIQREGFANSYYSAAVRSMLDNWHAFFFASLDETGFVTVDKPPVAYWIQTLSARVFGFHGWAILLPQGLSLVLAVFVLSKLVGRRFGPTAGLLAALFLAISPVNVANARNNTPDPILVLTVLLAAWFVLEGAERGSLRWYAAGMAVLGVGFNVKMLEAYLVLPAFLLVYFITPAVPWLKRIWHLAVGFAVCLIVSFSWPVAVQLTPASARPYIGSSTNNSIFDLIAGWNGISRLIPRGQSLFGITNGTAGQVGGPGGGPGGPGGVAQNGAKSVFRLLNDQLGGQIGWLIPLAILGFLIAWGWPAIGRLTHQRLSLAMWGGWFAAQVGFFSVAGFFHAYYMSMLAPGIAALAGIGVVAGWQALRSGQWIGWLFPAAIALTAGVQIYLLRIYGVWHTRLAPPIVGLAALGTVGLLVVRTGRVPRLDRGVLPYVVAGAAVLAVIVAPATWAGYASANGSTGLDGAGPRATSGNGRGGFGGGNFTVNDLPADVRAELAADFNPAQPGGGGSGRGNGGFGGRDGGGFDQATLNYLLANKGNATYLVAVTSAMEAAPIIIQTNEAVMAMGGFSGRDPILTVDSLKQMIAKGEVRFFMTGGRGDVGGFGGGRGGRTGAEGRGGTGGGAAVGNDTGGTRDRQQAENGSASAVPAGGNGGTAAPGFGGGPDGGTNAAMQWVQQTCKAVPAAAIQAAGTSSSTTTRGATLYDCQGVVTT
jgi:4-amino-4-deoxy-L-arabinose transferase-like glycosyltransferase